MEGEGRVRGGAAGPWQRGRGGRRGGGRRGAAGPRRRGGRRGAVVACLSLAGWLSGCGSGTTRSSLSLFSPPLLVSSLSCSWRCRVLSFRPSPWANSRDLSSGSVPRPAPPPTRMLSWRPSWPGSGPGSRCRPLASSSAPTAASGLRAFSPFALVFPQPNCWFSAFVSPGARVRVSEIPSHPVFFL